MKRKLTHITLATGIILSSMTFAQDVHFSQMAASPLNLNPALAGANSTIQGIVNYRSQWNSVAEPYKTIAASVDGRFNDGKRTKAGIIAGGLSFFNDKAGDMQVSTTNVNLSVAYHLLLGQKSSIGIGIYGGFGQRSIDVSDGRWGSQYDGSAYNTALPSNEVFNSPSFTYFDAGTGLVYTYKKNDGYMSQNNQRQFNGGVAFYHVNNPNYSFIDNGTEKLYMRWSIFANAVIGIANTKGALLPGVYFNRQKSTMEILYGTYYRITLTEGSKVTGFNKPFFLHLGLFHRWGDALVGKAMLEWSDLSAGFAYDINISSLNQVSSARGGFEVFLRYNVGHLTGPGSSRSRIR